MGCEAGQNRFEKAAEELMLGHGTTVNFGSEGDLVENVGPWVTEGEHYGDGLRFKKDGSHELVPAGRYRGDKPSRLGREPVVSLDEVAAGSSEKRPQEGAGFGLEDAFGYFKYRAAFQHSMTTYQRKVARQARGEHCGSEEAPIAPTDFLTWAWGWR